MGESYDFYNKYLEKLQAKAEEAVKEARENSFKEYFKVAEKRIKEIYEDTITDFYRHGNHSYAPRKSLYDLIETKIEDDGLSIDFNPSKIVYRKGYAESSKSEGVTGGLYDIVFRQGWHGGAMINGSMLYPVGSPVKPYDGTYEGKSLKPFKDNYHYGWKPADKAPISPLNDFRQRIDEYHKIEYQKIYDEIWNKHKQNIKISM